MMIIAGDTVQFDPFKEMTGFASEDNRGKLVTGTVVEVNYKHKWFSVEYGEPKQRISFKFCDIGERVNFVG